MTKILNKQYTTGSDTYSSGTTLVTVSGGVRTDSKAALVDTTNQTYFHLCIS